MPLKAYLAGPDVFLPNARAHAEAKTAICTRYGLLGRPPISDEIEQFAALPPQQAWRAIYLADIEMMQDCDVIIANLTPFRGASADAGTLVELGWFLGRGRPVFGYSNSATSFTERSAAQTAAVADPLPGLSVEGLALPDNLMIAGAVQYGGGLPITLPPDGQNQAFDSLDIFELCVASTARKLR